MYRFFKRLLDLLLATLAVVLLLPILIPVIIILMFTGEKEIFFFQQRIGYRNKPFKIWKFATMQKNSPNIGTGEITLRNDPRVTKFGRFLRRSKINELPQLFNVFSGDMSLVGPRPLMEVSFLLYPPDVRNTIYQSRPGMTGIGSLIFRDEEKLLSEAPDAKKMYHTIYPYKGELEIWYRRHASLWTDFKIIFLTAWSLAFPSTRLATRIFNNLPARNF